MSTDRNYTHTEGKMDDKETQHTAENDAAVWAALDPAAHCFREDGCAHHGPYPEGAPDRCCCCGYAAGAHGGCDCE